MRTAIICHNVIFPSCYPQLTIQTTSMGGCGQYKGREGSHSAAVCLCYYKTFSKPTSEAGHWPLVHGEESCMCLRVLVRCCKSQDTLPWLALLRQYFTFLTLISLSYLTVKTIAPHCQVNYCRTRT